MDNEYEPEYKRKLITTGHSFIVALPMDWIRHFNLGKGDLVRIRIKSDGSLVIEPINDL